MDGDALSLDMVHKGASVRFERIGPLHRDYKDQKLSLDKGEHPTVMVAVGPTNRPEAASFVVAVRGAGEQ